MDRLDQQLNWYNKTLHNYSNPIIGVAGGDFPPKWCHFLEDYIMKQLAFVN